MQTSRTQRISYRAVNTFNAVQMCMQRDSKQTFSCACVCNRNKFITTVIWTQSSTAVWMNNSVFLNVPLLGIWIVHFSINEQQSIISCQITWVQEALTLSFTGLGATAKIQIDTRQCQRHRFSIFWWRKIENSTQYSAIGNVFVLFFFIFAPLILSNVTNSHLWD